jgi:hypothetical protein
MRSDQALRMAALVLVGAAVVDPGCLRRSEPRVGLMTVADVDASLAADVAVAVATAGLRMADVDEVADVWVASGAPAAVLDAHRTRPVDVAVRPRDERPGISAIVAPTRTAVGLGTRIRIRPESDGLRAVSVTLRDALSGRVAARQTTEGVPALDTWLDLLVVPAAPGRWTLCASATAIGAEDSGGDGSGREGPRREGPGTEVPPRRPSPDVPQHQHVGDRSTAPCDALAAIDVAPGPFRIDVFEARAAWTGRFIRLALESWGPVDVHAETRLAPGIATRTRPPAVRRPASDLTVVAGLDALQPADVSRLRDSVAREGHTVVLLADGPWPQALLRDLWPDGAGRIVTSADPQAVPLGTGRWTVHEWLEPPPLHAGIEVLASMDGAPRVPVVLARVLGLGRVVVILALDGWRWRSADQDAFDTAWQSLVLSLILDGWTPDVRAWQLKGPLQDEVHLVRASAASAVDVRVVPGGSGAPSNAEDVSVSWHPDGIQGVARISSDALAVIADRPAVGNQQPSVIDVGPRVPLTGTWDDVDRVLSATGGDVVRGETLSGALARQASSTPGREYRWWVTRQWWYAATVLAVLGAEWWHRRRQRLP